MSFQKNTIASAAALVVMSLALPAAAQQTEEQKAAEANKPERKSSNKLDTVVITASKRAEAANKVPYNVSALTEEQLRDENITDAKKLISQSPAINAPGNGARFADSVTVRGLNVSPVNANNLEQFTKTTLAYYLDDTPLPNLGYRIKDIARVETLLGPQGTLYGAGSLGGTVRFITNKPQLGKTEARLNTGFYQTKNGGISNGTDVVLNVPLGARVALRASIARLDEKGYTDRVSNPPWRTGADAWTTKPDAKQNVYEDDDWQKVTGGRFSLLWKLSNDVSVTLAHTTQNQLAHGTSGVSKLPLGVANAKTPAERDAAWKNPYDRPVCASACVYNDSFLAPNAVNDHTVLSRYPEYADRKFRLDSVDLDWNLGFVALHSSTSRFTDARIGVGDYASQGYAYYSKAAGGVYTDFGADIDSDRSAYMSFDNSYKGISHETRLTSTGDGPISWIGGFYYTKHDKSLRFSEWLPGMEAYLKSIGSQMALAGGQPGEGYRENLASKYKETALFGEIGWRITPAWLTTVGGRVFNYEDEVIAQITDYAGDAAGADRGALTKGKGKSYYKLNTSYQLTPDLLAYATWSQGFRRGGTNAFRNEGSKIIRPELQSYKPDSTNNTEIGLKGFLFDRQLYIETDVYQIEWKDPQTYRSQVVGGVFPLNGTTNGPNAKTQGWELNARYKLGEHWQLSYSTTTTKAEWDGTLTQCLYTNGTSCKTWAEGGTLGGAPKWKHNLGLRFNANLADSYEFWASVRGSYVGAVQVDRTDSKGEAATATSYGSYTRYSLNAGLSKGDWDVSLWVQNLTNTQADVSNQDSGLMGYRSIYTTPRTIGVNFSYNFK
ncbi:MAG: TonB-dependent receptor [Burkholderiaceae bacterium]|nr:TonB-dependent receptor [Burkholderiaceae bacterium]